MLNQRWHSMLRGVPLRPNLPTTGSHRCNAPTVPGTTITSLIMMVIAQFQSANSTPTYAPMSQPVLYITLCARQANTNVIVALNSDGQWSTPRCRGCLPNDEAMGLRCGRSKKMTVHGITHFSPARRVSSMPFDAGQYLLDYAVKMPMNGCRQQTICAMPSLPGPTLSKISHVGRWTGTTQCSPGLSQNLQRLPDSHLVGTRSSWMGSALVV